MGKGPTTPSVPGNGEFYGRTPVRQFPVNPSPGNTEQMLFGIGRPTQPADNSVGHAGPGAGLAPDYSVGHMGPGAGLAPNSGTRPFPSSKGVSSQRQGDGFVSLDKPQAGGGFWDNFGSSYERSRQQRLSNDGASQQVDSQQALKDQIIAQIRSEDAERRRREQREQDKR